MKPILRIFALANIAFALLLGSCARDNSVTSNHGIQKRKYQSGYHFQFRKHQKSIGQDQNMEKDVLAVETSSPENQRPIAAIESADNNTVVINSEISENTLLVNEQATDNSTTKESKARVVQKMKNEKIESTHSFKSEKVSFSKANALKKVVKKSESSRSDIEPILYVLLCILIPFVAVGLATDWNVRDVVINLLLCCLCGIPGIVHAFIVCSREGVI